MRTYFLMLFLIPLLSGCAQHESNSPYGKIIDLTYSLGEDTIFWPTAEGFKLEVAFAGQTEKGYYYTANNFCTAEHGGTHIDAPVHFYKDRNTVDKIPLEQLIGKAVVVDVSEKCAADPDYLVTADDFLAWERAHGVRLNGFIVLIRTGFGKYWPDALKYLGTDEHGAEAVAKLHFPGLHPDAAKWLVENRSIKAIGLDTASIDTGQSTDFMSHVTLYAANIPAFENVANLDQLPETGFTIIALPIKIKGGSGGPLRIIALVKE
ncbi:MAG: cyclase family protein [bacterium]